MIRVALLAASIAASALHLHAQPAPAQTVAIVGATVFPMSANTSMLRDHTVVVAGNRITAIGPSATISVPSGARRVDGRGKYLIPGLADMHVHLEYFDKPDILALFLANGVTTVRNMDGRPYLLDWKRRIAAGELSGPRIYTAGPLLDGKPPVRPDNTVVETPEAARVEVAAQIAAGYDFVKVYSGLSPSAYQAISDAARRGGRDVSGHVPRAVGLEAVLASGQHAIEHLQDYGPAIEADTAQAWSKRYLSMPVTPAKIRAIAERQAKAGVWNVPTLIQPEREVLRDDEITARLASDEVQFIPAEGRKLWEQQTRRGAARMDDEDWKLIAAGRAHRLMLVAGFRDAGVPMVSGSDTPNPFVVPGFSLHDELALLVKAGCTPVEALAASTREAARFMGTSDWGTIESGKAADLLLLEASPLDDIANTRRIAGVMAAGRWLDTEARRAMLNALRGK